MATLTLAQALEDVLPYVESRLEDMAEDAETTNPEHRAEARRLYARAILSYRRAQRMLRREWDARMNAKEAAKRQTPKQFATFLSETLGPDLKTSGNESTSADVMKAGQMISSLLPDAANARAARALLRSKMDESGDFDLSNDDEHEVLLKLAEILGVK